MKFIVLLCLILVGVSSFLQGMKPTSNHFSNISGNKTWLSDPDSLPLVFPVLQADLVGSGLKKEACLKQMKFSLPATKSEYDQFKSGLKNEIIKNAGITTDHSLPLDVHETGTVKMRGFTIKKIYFQTLPGVYATANLYIPDGKGPFPAVINSNGHWPGAKMCEPVQSVAQFLARNGYVSLCIDAFGSGERSTIPGREEYHGANLGASLFNVGKSLLGIQVSENMRGVDLLSSLPYVDAHKIGATGASGGGNQALWLTAIDERIQAAVPVVSVGTFEAYILESNCVCELLVDGLTFTEESGVLALIAPRAVLMLNHSKETNPSFYPAQMLRSYADARPVYDMLGVSDNLNYQVFDLTHDYFPEDRQAMLSWFNQHLKKTAKKIPSKDFKFKKLAFDQLQVCESGNRDKKIKSIQDFCVQQGTALRNQMLASRDFDSKIKRNELSELLKIKSLPVIKNVNELPELDGWQRFVIESENGKQIPALLQAPRNEKMNFTLLCDPKGKQNILPARIAELKKNGEGIMIIDLYGTGENSSEKANTLDNTGLPQFHTLSRANIWLGKTIMGEWVEDLHLSLLFLEKMNKNYNVTIEANKETGLAALYFTSLTDNKVNNLILHETPVSYLFDSREGIDFYSMAIHLPGILEWGDVSLAAALSAANISFINPVTISGNNLSAEKLQKAEAEFDKMKTLCHQPGQIVFEKENR